MCVLCFAQRTPPSLISKQEPEYSEQARMAKLHGAVGLAIIIGEDGRPRDIRVVKPLGLGLDEKAIAAVSMWRFSPATKDGQAVAVESRVECNFRLQTAPGEWSLALVQFNVPLGATQPSILRAPRGAQGGSPESASVRVSFDIDTQGVPANIQVENSSGPQWNDEVIALIREWRFQAALDNGTAVASHALFDFSRGEANYMQVDMAPRKKNR